MNNVWWPPSYYILRDRVPFFLTLIYFHRGRINFQMRQLFGLYFTAITALFTLAATFLYLIGDNMYWISGIAWSPPSPIQWGSLIFVGTIYLKSRLFTWFESFYMAFITAMGGGWLYEAHGWILDPNVLALLKINSVKVFFMEFQLFCLPIMIYLIKTHFTYKRSRLLIPLIIFAVLFYGFNVQTKQFFADYVGYYAYRWYIRLPTIAVLGTMLTGIKGEKHND